MSEHVKATIEELEIAKRETDKRLEEILDEVLKLPNVLDQANGVDREIQERLMTTLEEVVSALRSAAEDGKDETGKSFSREIQALTDYLGG